MLKLFIPEMTCGGCENKIRKALAQVQEIDSIKIDRETKQVEVDGAASASGIIKAIEDVGFTVSRIAA